MSEFTKGEWKREGNRNIVNYDSKGIVDIAVVLGPLESKEADANFNLLLSAPDMYEALKELTDIVCAIIDGRMDDNAINCLNLNPAKSALAKAENKD